MREYSEMEGEEMVRAVRAAIELSIRSSELDIRVLSKPFNSFGAPNGLFVTIYHYPSGEIRNRKGIYGTGKPMGELLIATAIGAAFRDTSSVPVSMGELGSITIRIDILSGFEEISSSGRARLIKVRRGTDGLLINYGVKSAILLPSFIEENKLDKVGFFEAACEAIGIQKDLWMQPNVSISSFETQCFAEDEPDGRVRRVKMQE